MVDIIMCRELVKRAEDVIMNAAKNSDDRTYCQELITMAVDLGKNGDWHMLTAILLNLAASGTSVDSASAQETLLHRVLN